MEHEKQAERLEKEAEALSEHGDDIGGRIEQARREWEGKKTDSSVPGAVTEGGVDWEESMEREESDQMPEEGPSGQVPDDADEDSRDEAEQNPGVPDEEDTSTGNPDAAGADD